jgi:acetyl esterase
MIKAIAIAVAVCITAYFGYYLAQHPQIPIREKLATVFIRTMMKFCGVGGSDPRYVRSLCSAEKTFTPNDGAKDGIKINIISAPLIYGNTTKNIVVRHLSQVNSVIDKLPLLIFTHGGGYVTGNADLQDHLLKSIIKSVPMHILSIEYRKAPAHPFPAALYDVASVWTAINTMDKQKQYEQGWEFLESVDMSKIMVSGDSAGGGLAISAALVIRDKRLPYIHEEQTWHLELSDQILIYPCVQLKHTAAWKKPENHYILEPAVMEYFIDAYMLDAVTKEGYQDNHYLFPLKAKSFEGLPPSLIITGEYDILHDDGEMYANKLKQAGVPVEHANFEGVHGFITTLYFRGYSEAEAKIISYLRKV